MKDESPTESGRTTDQAKTMQYSEVLQRFSKIAEQSILRPVFARPMKSTKKKW